MLSLSQCYPEDSSPALFLDNSRFLMRSESCLCMTLHGSVEVTFRQNSRSLEVAGCGVSLGVFSSCSLKSREKLLGVLE
jgi:hypothetical protein